MLIDVASPYTIGGQHFFSFWVEYIAGVEKKVGQPRTGRVSPPALCRASKLNTKTVTPHRYIIFLSLIKMVYWLMWYNTVA